MIEIFFQNHPTRPVLREKAEKRGSDKGSPFKEKQSKTWYPSEQEKENILELELSKTEKTHFSKTDSIVEANQKSWSHIAGVCFLFMKLNDQINKKKKSFFSRIHGKRK